MKLTGKHTVNAVPSRLWKIFMDPQSLAKLVPGTTSLERISENSFKSVLQVRIGPVSGSFSGNVLMEDIVDEKSFLLKVKQDSKIGNADASIRIELTPVNEQETIITFDGDARLTGLLASMGQRITDGVSATLTKQFFNNLDKELAN